MSASCINREKFWYLFTYNKQYDTTGSELIMVSHNTGWNPDVVVVVFCKRPCRVTDTLSVNSGTNKRISKPRLQLQSIIFGLSTGNYCCRLSRACERSGSGGNFHSPPSETAVPLTRPPAIIGLVALTFWPLNRFTGYPRDGLPSYQCWSSSPFVRELGQSTRQTDSSYHFIIPPHYGSQGHNKA